MVRRGDAFSPDIWQSGAVLLVDKPKVGLGSASCVWMHFDSMCVYIGFLLDHRSGPPLTCAASCVGR